MNIRLYLFAASSLLFSANALSEKANINSCDNAPKGALLAFDAPYSAWFKVECDGIRKAHFVSAQSGYEWKEVNTAKPYAFNAFGPISPKFDPIELHIYEPHKYHFLKAKASVMTASQLKGVNEMLPSGSKEYKNVHQLDVLTNTKTVYSFFTFLENEAPEWIVACVNYSCQTAARIKVIKR